MEIYGKPNPGPMATPSVCIYIYTVYVLSCTFVEPLQTGSCLCETLRLLLKQNKPIVFLDVVDYSSNIAQTIYLTKQPSNLFCVHNQLMFVVWRQRDAEFRGGPIMQCN